MHHFTKKEKSNSSHLLQRDKSNQDAIFKLFKPLQLIPALHSTETTSFGTVHVADLCTTAQKLLAATKTYWE